MIRKSRFPCGHNEIDKRHLSRLMMMSLGKQKVGSVE